MYKDVSKRAVFESSGVGLSFDFISPYSRQDLASKFAKVLRRRVSFGIDKDVTLGEARLSPIYSGGFKMNRLRIGRMPYYEAQQIMMSAMDAIGQFGHTDEKCDMIMAVSVECNSGSTKDLDPMKFIMNFNEAKFISDWAKNKSGMTYKLRLESLYMTKPFERPYHNMNEAIYYKDYIIPESMYFGTNLASIQKGCVEFKYAGGRNYERRKADATELMDAAIESVHQAITEKMKYTEFERSRLKFALQAQGRLLDSIKTYEAFVKNNEGLELYVDLKGGLGNIKHRYNDIRETVFKLIAYGGVKEGKFNWDTEIARFQVKGANIREGFMLENFDFHDSKLKGEFRNCEFMDCEITKSKIFEGNLRGGTKVTDSKIIDCGFSDSDVELNRCFVSSETVSLRAKVKECMLKCPIGWDSEIDDATEILK